MLDVVGNLREGSLTGYLQPIILVQYINRFEAYIYTEGITLFLLFLLSYILLEIAALMFR